MACDEILSFSKHFLEDSYNQYVYNFQHEIYFAQNFWIHS